MPYLNPWQEAVDMEMKSEGIRPLQAGESPAQALARLIKHHQEEAVSEYEAHHGIFAPDYREVANSQLAKAKANYAEWVQAQCLKNNASPESFHPWDSLSPDEQLKYYVP